MDIVSYLINVLIFGQSLLFMYLYERSLRTPDTSKHVDIGILNNDVILEVFLYMATGIVIFALFLSGFTFQFYKTNLLIQYVFLVSYAYQELKKSNRVLTAISLSFLLVFFNSYLWESVLHFAEYTIAPIMIFNFRELIHLIVLPFLHSHYTVDKAPVLNKLRILLFINFLFSILTIEVYPRIRSYQFNIPFFNHPVGLTHFINRFISLIILLDIFTKHLTAREERRNWFIGWLNDE